MSNRHNQVLGFLTESSLRKKPQLKGDTLVEVMFAVGIFGMVAIGAIGIMNKGLYDAQKALEITMARQEIDAQAEAIRFVHEASIAEQNASDKLYSKAWDAIRSKAYKPNDIPAEFFTAYNNSSCDSIYTSDAFPIRSFIINYRRLSPEILQTFVDTNRYMAQVQGDAIIVYNASYLNDDAHLLAQTPVYPRIIFSNTYGRNRIEDITSNLSDRDINESTGQENNTYYDTVTKAQGIWVTGIASAETNPEFYDFYIRTCWDSPGSGTSTTISTTVRLFNHNHHP